MKTSNLILLLFVSSMLISCSEDNNYLEYNIPYFQFKDEDCFDPYKTEIIDVNWQLPTLEYMYFHINEGIIGFDTREGNEWRLKS
jgi:hypothetical protein